MGKRKLTSFPRFPVITGEESQAEQYRLGRQLGAWRSAWLGRLYGGWAVVAVPVILFGGRYGWGIAGMTLGAVLVPHILIQARVLAATGQKGYATFHRVMAVYFAVAVVVALVLWIMAVL